MDVIDRVMYEAKAEGLILKYSKNQKTKKPNQLIRLFCLSGWYFTYYPAYLFS